MLKNISSYFYKNYFNRSLPLEYRVFMIFFFENYFISIFFATKNTLLSKSLFGVALQWFFILFYTHVLFFPVSLRIRFSKGLLVFITFLYIPFLFFQASGYYSALFYAFLSVFLLAVVFKGKVRIAAITFNLAIHIACCLVQYFSPALFLTQSGLHATLVDLLVAFTLSVAGSSIMTVYISNAFANEEKRTKKLVHDLEQSGAKLAEMSYRDPLTGAYNRRYLAKFLDRTFLSCNDTGKHIFFMMLDIDQFKLINDTYGHGFGDEVLLLIVDRINKSLRSSDTLVRFGGDEFSVILYDIDDHSAIQISERICDRIRCLTFRNGAAVTVSIGLVKSRSGETQQELFKRADTQLYRAKHEGRNRVCYED